MGLQPIPKNPQHQLKQELTKTTNKRLQTSLQTKSKNSHKTSENQAQKLPADLAEIVAVWPKLPEHIKQAIRALIKTVQG